MHIFCVGESFKIIRLASHVRIVTYVRRDVFAGHCIKLMDFGIKFHPIPKLIVQTWRIFFSSPSESYERNDDLCCHRAP